ncbi:hypothetical protein PTR23_03270 [Serratia nevei]|uniref:hypothetical protein n=1 Tax=Serratia TaxID=613 RepID=UPI000AF835A9|nr:hypothetical protein [Serratia marcescens]BEN39455.1 hypothetical protein SMKC049_12470 [Serratia marcescens]
MSEEINNSIENLPITQIVKVRDEALTFLCKMANLDIGVGVTILIKGTVLTGTLISGDKYFKVITEKFKALGSGEVASLISNFFEDFGRETYSIVEGEIPPPTNFLHLADVEIVNGNGRMIGMSDGLLRLKIEEIDGSMIGQLKLQKQ